MMKPIVSRGKFTYNAEEMRGRFKSETQTFVKRLTARKNRRFIKQVTTSEVAAFVVHDRDADFREQAALFDWAADALCDYDGDVDIYGWPEDRRARAESEYSHYHFFNSEEVLMSS